MFNRPCPWKSPSTEPALGAAAPLYTEVFGKHNIALNSFDAGFSVVNSLPAYHALILGRKERMSVHKAPGAESCSWP